MKHTLPILALFTLHSSLFTLSAALPLSWTVETSRAQVAQFESYRGETLDLEATMKSYGSPLATPVQPSLYWQTNGMGAAWWMAPATASGNVLRATWSPTNDCGGTVYNCFIGGTGATYRAAFRLRMLPSPGFTPNHIPLPTVKAESDPVFSAWLATNEFSSAALDTNTVLGLITSATNELEGVGTGRQIIRGSNQYGPWDITVFNAQTAQTAQGDSDGRSIIDTYAEKSEVNDLHDRYNEISGTVSAWQTYWDGDDVRVTVTNYYGNLDIPSLYLEQKMQVDETHDSPWFKVVWDERTRWNRFMPTFSALTNDVAQNKADRAWGVYDSSTGEYSPDGLLQLSQEQIMIAPGMSYQKTVTAGGNAYWVLRANDPTTVSGVTSNGFFRIEDFDGNALFEIVKGDKRVVGASIASINIEDYGLTLTFNVESDNPPEVYFANSLSDGEWNRIERSGESAWAVQHWEVEWSGASGAWVASITWNGGSIGMPSPPNPPQQGFFRATYETGGNTYIRNNVATSIDKVVVGGIEYTVTVETVNGKKLLVLQ